MKSKKLKHIKSSGYKTPSNYFDTFDEKVLKRMENTHNLDTINQTGFKVPNDYFTDVEAAIINKVSPNKKAKVIHLNTKTIVTYVTGIAASLLLFFVIITNINNEEPITTEMVTTHFENSDLSTYELAELLAETEFLDEDFTISEAEYLEENLEDYLLENTDIETILTQ